MKIAVGMSGGVDSSVAALLLKEQGHDVTGITMSVWDNKRTLNPAGKHACYGPDEKEDIDKARQICRLLDIPFHVFDCSKEYNDIIIEYFRTEYFAGRTPNPCVECNHKIKFNVLLQSAKSFGINFDKFATGHYARVEFDGKTERYLLKKGADKKKDQSYFLYKLNQPQLADIIFPLGDMTKETVRNLAVKNNIPVSEEEESQDFYSGDYRDLLDTQEKEGNIILTNGKILGKHKGIWNFTTGQRKGLGIAFPEPLYVLRLDRETNSVIVGIKDEINNSKFIVNKLNWITEKPASSFSANARIRSTSNEFKSVIEPLNENEAKVELLDTNESISPGQSAVFYQDDYVIGGGIIDRVIDK